MIDFNDMIRKAKEAISFLTNYHDYIPWIDYSDEGVSKPYEFASRDARINDALWLAAVKVALPKGSHAHTSLAIAISKDIGACWVTYDWVIKVVARIIARLKYSGLKKMLDCYYPEP